MVEFIGSLALRRPAVVAAAEDTPAVAAVLTAACHLQPALTLNMMADAVIASGGTGGDMHDAILMACAAVMDWNPGVVR
jgi:hypothetical protein